MLYTYIYRRQRFAPRCTHIIVTLLLLFLLIPTTCLRAQNVNRTNYQLLWRIDGHGQKAPSYLFGTMHLTEKRVFDFSDSVLVALRNASDFAMEVDMDSMMSYMFSPGGPLLDTVNHMRRLFTPEEYRYVDSLVVQKVGVPIAQLNLKRLWFIENLLLDEVKELGKQAGANQKKEDIFLDAWLHQKATALNKPIHSLERIQNQMHIMSAEVSEVQKEVFLWNLGYHDYGSGDANEMADRFTKRVSALDSLVNLYYEADLQKIAKLVDSWRGDEEGPGLEARNREMTDNLALLAGKGGVFAAVGVAHLPGDKGMLALLRAKGFTVTPVKATFTGVTKHERQRLDSIKGSLLNRIADGYSVMLPGTTVVYPVPNSNRSMYIGTSENETGFALSVDLPQLATDKQQLENSMVANMARQGKSVLKKSYPIVYRDISGTEALLEQGEQQFYIRVFIRNHRSFVFMHATPGKDSIARKDFFNSVRFYDIARPVAKYDTLYRPQLGFTAVVPSDASHIITNPQKESRPEEAWSGLDDVNHVSFVLRVEKMQRGYYNTSDKELFEGLRSQLLLSDSTRELIDSTVTTQNGLPLYRLIYRHRNGFISRLHYIPRGNLGYCLLCVYDGARTDSSVWKRFFDGFKITPLLTKAPVVPFVADDNAFTVSGPEQFVGGAFGERKASSPVNIHLYNAMDSASHAMYIVEVDRYSRYYHEHLDSIMHRFLHNIDSSFITTGIQQSTVDGLPAYETMMKGRYTGLNMYRKAIVAGHTIYRLYVIEPEEVMKTGNAQQFLASFHPGPKEKADTLRLEQDKLPWLLSDLQSADTVVFQRASAYLENFYADSTRKEAILSALSRPFPSDTGKYRVKIKLLSLLKKTADADVVHIAEQLFANTNYQGKVNILHFLTNVGLDTAVRTFIRLAPEMPERPEGNSIFSYDFRKDSLFQQYLPAMIATAKQSLSFLQAFTAYTNGDSLWLAPRYSRYGMETLLPATMQLFERQLKAWKQQKVGANMGWAWKNSLLQTGEILALPGMPQATIPLFRQLLADTVVTIRALGARGLMNKGVKVDDKMLGSIIKDNTEGYYFIQAVNDDKLLPRIRHLLSQDVVGRSYVANYLSDDNELTAIEPVTRVKVQEGKQPAQWLLLFRYKVEGNEDWEYVLNGPFPLDQTKLNLQPGVMHWIKDPAVIKDRKKLQAEAMEAYSDYLEEE